MDAVRRTWLAGGRSAADLRYETFGNSGWYAAEPFEVSVPELGITTTVPASQTMLDALSAAGAELMWDCRKGECGLCEMAVTSIEGGLDHRDVFLSEGQKAEGRRLCVCVARAVGGGPSAPARITLAFS
jgi:vanillate O-demethylase ferredoxin subunit